MTRNMKHDKNVVTFLLTSILRIPDTVLFQNYIINTKIIFPEINIRHLSTVYEVDPENKKKMQLSVMIFSA